MLTRHRVVEMNRFVITAKRACDILALLQNTREHYQDVEWNDKSVEKFEGEVEASESDLVHLIEIGAYSNVDAHIMSGEVPGGGMIVVADKDNPPSKGFVCGNGIYWHVIDLPDDIINAVMKKLRKGH